MCFFIIVVHFLFFLGRCLAVSVIYFWLVYFRGVNFHISRSLPLVKVRLLRMVA
jgi:hypothetical protein